MNFQSGYRQIKKVFYKLHPVVISEKDFYASRGDKECFSIEKNIRMQKHIANCFFVFGLITLLVMGFSFSTFAKKTTVKVAMAQIFCLDGDRSGNFVRIENAIIEAKKRGAEIVTFPETSILGWVNPDAHERAFPIPGADSDKLCVLAKNHKIFINIGLAEKEGEKLFDSAILIDDEGNILLKHRKINILTELMSLPYFKGEKIGAVDTRLGRIGLMICADSFQDSLLMKMKKQNPDFVIIPYGWAADEKAWPNHGKELKRVVQHAAELIKCPVIGTDLVGEISHGPWQGMVYGGQSITVDQNTNVCAICKDRDKEVIVFKLKYNHKNETK